MGRAIKTGLVSLGLLALWGCEAAHTDVTEDVRRLERQASRGVDLVEQALATLTFYELNEGTRMVEASVRELSDLEQNDRLGDQQRLMLIVHQAKAQDQLVTALLKADAPETFNEEQTEAFQEIVFEMSLPMSEKALWSYNRALEHLCSSGLEDDQAAFQITSAIIRLGGRLPLDSPPCRE